MYQEVYTSRIKKDVKLVKKQGKDKDKLTEVIELLKNGVKLDEKYKDHFLEGRYINCKECHITPDWLLIYRIDKKENKLYLLRTGSHSELFKESFSIKIELNKLNEELEKLLDEEITLELKEDDYHGNVIYDIYIDNEYAGALEGNYKEDINSFYIENIKKNNNYKGHELLKKVVNYLFDEKGYDLGCLPLPKYRSYYEELGFTEFMRNGEDIFYHKTH